ncbi:DUF4129 domain-containing protein [Flagellimonas allohymeniacidonis]|uniref:DUF4129 domain-containing protein n=1 Tax=Flagellimonas allohymeniacidonis TaxID=2517819 RepID=A0A4Q8QD34_9FLAO|nr:DUF4129 domain-containing protein [Allomuricauda hymeniacidonis]TAI48271.1 DUF4129 domain-containing protein [Allomuricauda hymeniacidonis]
MIKKILILLAFPLISFGNLQPQDSLKVPYDQDSDLIERSFDKNLSEKYTGSEFDYDVKTGESQNLLARFLNWIFSGLNDLFGIHIPPNISVILEYLIYGLMGLLVIYLITRFLINEKFSSIFTKKANSILDIDLSEQHIESLDLDELMRSALKSRDFRLAVRYQYLKILKQLSQKHIIDWHFEKTNSDYEREIKDTRLKSGFREVSYLYENIWYGEQPINEGQYEMTQQRFTNLNVLIPQ